MRFAIAIVYVSVGSYALLAAIGLAAFLVVLTKSILLGSRKSALPVLKIGLLGGLFATSSPFQWLISPLAPVGNYLFLGTEYFQANVFKWSSWYPYWLSNFLVGFLIAIVALSLFRKVRSARTRASAP